MCKGLVFAVTNDHVLASIVTQLIKSFLIETFIYHAGVIQAQMSACHCWILWCFLQNQTVCQTYRLQLGQVCKTACKQLIRSQSLYCVISPLDGLKSLQVCFAARYNYHLIQLSLSSILITPRSHQHLSLSVVLRLD